MVRHGLTFLVVLGLAATARAEEPIPPQPDATEAVTPDAMFEALASMGDLERAAGRLASAARNYQKALRIRRDPVIAGRLGVLLARLGLFEEAAEHLLDGFQRGRNTTAAERESFQTHYNDILAKGSWVKVIVSHAGARLTLDQRRGIGGPTAFFMFLEPGEHTIHGNLDGFDDATVTFTVEKGKDREVEVTFTPRPVVLEKPMLDEPAPRKKKLPPGLGLAVSVGGPEYSKQEDPYAYAEEQLGGKKATPGLHGSLGAGPVVVFGVASWNPAVGLFLAGSLRPHENVSIGLEGRGAWLTSAVADRQISAMTAGGLVSACGHWRWFFGCALGHLGVIAVSSSNTSYKTESFTFVKPGFGGRVGAELHVTRSVTVKAGIDVMGLTSGLQVIVGQTRLVDQPPVLVGAQLGGAWEF